MSAAAEEDRAKALLMLHDARDLLADRDFLRRFPEVKRTLRDVEEILVIVLAVIDREKRH